MAGAAAAGPRTGEGRRRPLRQRRSWRMRRKDTRRHVILTRFCLCHSEERLISVILRNAVTKNLYACIVGAPALTDRAKDSKIYI